MDLTLGGCMGKYDKYFEIADGIYWIGVGDEVSPLHSNPYMILDEGEVVVLDGGSRPDFSTVVLKILETGVRPQNISALIYHHYDPDLCGSMNHFEQLINSDDLVVISQRHNNIFINHYGVNCKKLCINSIENKWLFKSGRELQFINTPYSHSPGSFTTYDKRTKTLFSSDIFGSYNTDWGLKLEPLNECYECKDHSFCKNGMNCFFNGIADFHKLIMTSSKALKHSLDKIKSMDIERIAPQHGSIIEGKKNINMIIDYLYSLDDIGIDGEEVGKIY